MYFNPTLKFFNVGSIVIFVKFPAPIIPKTPFAAEKVLSLSLILVDKLVPLLSG